MEGSEWLNEILWTLLDNRTQLTLDVLAQLDQENRRWLADNVYTQPIHDRFDFAGIREQLRTVVVPPGLESVVRRIVEAMDVSLSSAGGD